MAEPRRASGDRLAQAALASASIAAFASGQRSRAALLLVLPVALSAFVGRPAPPVVLATLRRATRALLAAVIVLGFIVTAYPTSPESTYARIALWLGWALGPLLALQMLGAASVPAAGVVLPPCAGLCVLASLDPGAVLAPYQAGAAAALLLYAAAGDRTARPRGGTPRPRWPGLVAYAALVAAVAYGIVRLLPWAQPQVEQKAAEWIASPDRAYSGLGERSTLGDIETLGLSRALVLREWTDRPQKLRARVFTDFDGRTWSAPPLAAVPMPEAGDAILPALDPWLRAQPGRTYGAPGSGRGLVRTRIVQAAPPQGLLLAPAGARLVRVDDAPLRDALFVLRPGGIAPDAYAVVSEEGPDAPVAGALAARCLVLPAGTDPRLAALAAQLGEGARSPAERVQRTIGWLGRECRYALNVGRFRTRDPVADFVLEKKRGYCEYFASAAAVLLRLQGVPARYVAGFAVDDAARIAGHYEVRESDAHAWIEVFLPDEGWVEADPTPAADYEAVHEPLRGGVWEAVQAWWSELRFEGFARAASSLQGIRLRAAAGVVLLTAAALAGWRRRRRRPRDAPRPAAVSVADDAAVPPELRALMARVERRWTASGAARPQHRAPLEHASALEALGIAPQDAAAGRAVVACYYRARFGAEPIPRDEIAALGEQLDRLP